MFHMSDVSHFQSQVNNLESELSQVKDSSLHQKKRVTDMMLSLLRDLGEIGMVINDDLKVW